MILALLGWHLLAPSYLDLPAQHMRHAELFGDKVPEFNRLVLQGIDTAQSTAMLGGGYFTGIKAKPTESPIGYQLSLGDKPLLDPPRTTSYCSGASYSAFIEGINLWLASRGRKVPENRLESLRMQEPDGGRREDHVKFWGHWNADGFGNQFALVQYSGMGTRVDPEKAIPGDFLNISWKSGLGHSTVFLGWCLNKEGKKAVRFWSSQKGTNGMGDMVAAIDTIVEVCVVRVNHPERIFSFDPQMKVEPKISGDPIRW